MKSNSCKCKEGCSCRNCRCGPYALFFDVLGNETRLSILLSISEEEKAVTKIIEETGIEQTHVSHSLAQLEKYGFVKSEKKGKYRMYALNMKVGSLLKLIDSHVEKYCRKYGKPCSCGVKQ